MKNLLYILIFLPSLLFSQETKNMELVGVRNINVLSDSPILNFEIEEGNILKIINVTHSGTPDYSLPDVYMKLNNEYIYYSGFISGSGYGNIGQLNISFPFYLNAGNHSISINGNHNEISFSSTLYGLEFKLTTP